MSRNHTHQSGKNIATAFFLNLFFAFVELAGGFITNSVAILSDAIHDFGDSLSLGVAWYLQKVSEKKGDDRFSYGYKRFSLLGSLFISIVLVVGSIFIIMESLSRLSNPEDTDGLGMIILAVAGIIINGIAVLKLKRGKSHNEKAVLLHMMEDVLGWIAVFVGGIVVYLWEISIVDPLLSLLIGLWVLFNVYRNLSSTIAIMLQEVPRDINLKELEEDFSKIPSVDSFHDLHIWSLDGEKHILSVHIVLGSDSLMKDSNRIKEDVRAISLKHGIGHVTVEVELTDEAKECRYNNNPC
jgi:cobalt-zinc-cadmium efflux system protein